jgi:hypothetical protein
LTNRKPKKRKASKYPREPKQARQPRQPEKPTPDPDRDALIERYPQGNRRALWAQVVAVLAGNSVVAYLLAIHRIQPLDLLVLVWLEGMMLLLVAAAQFLAVPRSATPAEVSGKVGAWLGAMLVGFAALMLFSGAFTAGIPGGEKALGAFLTHPVEQFKQARLFWPLSITLAAALADVLRDGRFFARRGGRFVSTPSLSAQARFTTLLLGLAPGAILVLGILFGGRKYFKRREERPVVIFAWLGSFVALVGGLVIWRSKTGLAGWLIGYCAAKITSELFFVFLPVISAHEKAKEEAARLERQAADSRPQLPPAEEPVPAA